MWRPIPLGSFTSLMRRSFLISRSPAEIMRSGCFHTITDDPERRNGLFKREFYAIFSYVVTTHNILQTDLRLRLHGWATNRDLSIKSQTRVEVSFCSRWTAFEMQSVPTSIDKNNYRDGLKSGTDLLSSSQAVPGSARQKILVTLGPLFSPSLHCRK